MVRASGTGLARGGTDTEPGAATIASVELTLVPEPAPEVARAVELAAASEALDSASDAYRSRWREAALAEAVATLRDRGEPEPGRYALSPRSTRGAMRA